MKIRYFRVTDDARVDRIAPRRIEGAFLERRRWSEPGDYGSLRIVSFLCDRNLLPVEAHFLKLDVVGGRISNESRFDLVALFQNMAARREGVSKAGARFIREQQTGWPPRAVMLPALAQALDVPVKLLPESYLGGPLVLALTMGVSVQQSLSYRRELIEKRNTSGDL